MKAKLTSSILFLSVVAWTQSGLDDLILPRKTSIFITLGRTINSRTAQDGDKVFATVAAPVAVNDQIIIPVGSFITGEVIHVNEPGRLKGKGELQLNFDTVILPDGVTRKIRSVVASADRYGSKHTDEQGKIEAPGSQGGEVAKGAAKTGAGGAIGGALAGRSLAGAGIGAAIGAGAGGLFSLFKRGQDVVLAKGASVTIQLESDVQFVKPDAVKESNILEVKKTDSSGKPEGR